MSSTTQWIDMTSTHLGGDNFQPYISLSLERENNVQYCFDSSVMANNQTLFSLLLILTSSSLFLSQPSNLGNGLNSLNDCGFDSIYQLGDSLSDTGNDIIENPDCSCCRLPYGESFFNKPTGRCSNGLLMIDYIASSAGLPFLDPYLNKNGSINNGKGKNFAVSGSTALSSHALASKNLTNPFTNNSLTDQLSWMTSHFDSLCLDIKDCAQKFKNSLFFVGEIGGNDYNYALLREKGNFKEVMEMVPQVVQAIKDAIKNVIAYGAVRVIVSGNLPIGCVPLYLTIFKTNISWAYDKYQCFVEFNKFAMYHNKQLKLAIEDLNKQHPSVTIVYGDYYNAFMWVLQNAPRLGFKAENLLKACWEATRPGVKDFRLRKTNRDYSDQQVCSNPDDYISWDGLHLTQNAYKHMSTWILRDILPKLHCGKYAELETFSSEIPIVPL